MGLGGIPGLNESPYEFERRVRANRRLYDPAIELPGGKILRGVPGESHEDILNKHFKDLKKRPSGLKSGFWNKIDNAFLTKSASSLESTDLMNLDELQNFFKKMGFKGGLGNVGGFAAGLAGSIGPQLFENIYGPLVQQPQLGPEI